MRHDLREFEYEKQLERNKMRPPFETILFYIVLGVSGIFFALCVIEVIFRPMTLQ